ncbi:hemerythrin [Desulfomarina profundi]|uniref:Hemerythrin n=1 Tax=Desulfomarina profundi TaxID=2772557 RepID=A0A8D5FRU2_9BACT|nr:bacteriohemerythrin [Desulfomarina profundi]BCL62520.1 hemerythrin [Desulfomarina profundi]
MPLIKWRDSYSVGVEQFDNEHKILVDLINEMFIVVRDKKSVDHLAYAIDQLIEYTQNHFSSEEEALAQVNYPDLDAHKDMHGRLIKDVQKHKKRIENNDRQERTDFYHFLRDWLLTHIVEEDMLYKNYFS